MNGFATKLDELTAKNKQTKNQIGPFRLQRQINFDVSVGGGFPGRSPYLENKKTEKCDDKKLLQCPLLGRRGRPPRHTLYIITEMSLFVVSNPR